MHQQISLAVAQQPGRIRIFRRMCRRGQADTQQAPEQYAGPSSPPGGGQEIGSIRIFVTDVRLAEGSGPHRYKVYPVYRHNPLSDAAMKRHW